MELTFTYYNKIYKGDSVPAADFIRLKERANAKLRQWERIYTISEPDNTPDGHDATCDATCAMIDTMYYFECVSNGLIARSSSIGSVSSTFGGTIDDSPKAQEKQLLDSASMYLDLYRGVKC